MSGKFKTLELQVSHVLGPWYQVPGCDPAQWPLYSATFIFGAHSLKRGGQSQAPSPSLLTSPCEVRSDDSQTPAQIALLSKAPVLSVLGSQPHLNPCIILPWNAGLTHLPKAYGREKQELGTSLPPSSFSHEPKHDVAFINPSNHCWGPA